jgi:hypothetical protein
VLTANWPAIRDQAHAMKNVAGNLGLQRPPPATGQALMHLPGRTLLDEW